eukprot:jgi/Ulvmu1/7660/UM038_0089.1
MEQLRHLSVANESIGSCRKFLIAQIRRGVVKEAVEAIMEEAGRRAHDPSVQADFSHAKGQNKLALLFLIDAVFLNAQLDRDDASLSSDARQMACTSISPFLPELIRKLTTPSNYEQVDRLLAGWKIRKINPRFDPVHISQATECMARAKTSRMEQLRSRVAARFILTSDDKKLPLKIGSMYGTFLPRGPHFGDPALMKPEHPIVAKFKSQLGERYRPSMAPPAPATLSCLKINTPAAGKFEVEGDDAEAASWDWADEEEYAVRQRLRVKNATDSSQRAAAAQPTTPLPAQKPASGEAPARAPAQAPVPAPAAAPANGVAIPGIPAQSLPPPPKLPAVSAQPPVAEAEVPPLAVQPREAPGKPQEDVRPGEPPLLHGLPPPQSLPQPADLPPPSGSFASAPPWLARPHAGRASAPMALHMPQHHVAAAPSGMGHDMVAPPAAPYTNFGEHGDSAGYMPPLPSEPYDGDASPPPPLPDEPPPLPDEPYEEAFPDAAASQPHDSTNGHATPGAAKPPDAEHHPTAATGSSWSGVAHDYTAVHGQNHSSAEPTYAHAHIDPAAAAGMPQFARAAAPQSAYSQTPPSALTPPARPMYQAEAPPPLPPADDDSPPPPLPPQASGLPPPLEPPTGYIRPPSHPPPYGVQAEWAPQGSPPSFQPQQPGPAFQAHEAPYHTPPSSAYNHSPHSTPQVQVHATAFPAAFPGSPERYSQPARRDLFPPRGLPPHGHLRPPLMTPSRPLQPPPGNPPPLGANPVTPYHQPPSGFQYRGPSPGQPMHADANMPQYHGWGPGPGYEHAQPPMGYAPPPQGEQPLGQQPIPMQQQPYGGGGYFPPPPPSGGHGQMNGVPGGGKRPRRW